MQVFGKGRVLEGVVGAFERGRGGGVEVLELGSEAHTDFEGIGHLGESQGDCWMSAEKVSSSE